MDSKTGLQVKNMSGAVPESQVVGSYVPESQDCDVGSVHEGAVQQQEEDHEVDAELGLPDLSMRDKCERLQRDQADIRRFNVACNEDDRRYISMEISTVQYA